MNISFMTWVCPTWDLDQIIGFINNSAYSGVELRVDSDHHHGVSSSTSPTDRQQINKKLELNNIDIPCIATSEHLAHSDLNERINQTRVAKANIELAGDLDAKYVRVFANGDRGELSDRAADDLAERLSDLGEFGRDYNVTPLLETMHDIINSPEAAQMVVDRVETDNFGLLWNQADISKQAFENLGEHIKHVHLHEPVLDAEFQGQIDLFSYLKKADFQGYFSLEIIRGEDLPEEKLLSVGERLQQSIKAS